MTLHFIHRIDYSNMSDICCCPYQYFRKYFKKYFVMFHDISNINFDYIKKDDFVIIGGGGLLNCLEEWNVGINRVLERCSHVFLWGAGINKHFDSEEIKTQIDFKKFTLIGVRDYKSNYDFNYLPCPSCMIKELKKKYEIKRKIGVLGHKDFKVSKSLDGAKILNSFGLNEIIDFIGSSEVILTNSYHAAYWSILMNKKVVLSNTFSEKFNYFKQELVNYSGDLEADIDISQNYPKSLKEARRLNKRFAKKVKFIMDVVNLKNKLF